MTGKHAKPPGPFGPRPNPEDQPVVPHETCPPHQPVQVGTDENGQPKSECRRCGAPC